MDARFVEEARKFRLRFACPDCAYFQTESRSCSNGYPAAPHLVTDPVPGSVVIFCKSFELL
ncbi:MAG TPA: hypothetical protein VI197_19810 [Polyangiaceae bacterium]